MSKLGEVLKRPDVLEMLKQRYKYKDGKLRNSKTGTIYKTYENGYVSVTIRVDGEIYGVGVHRIIYLLHHGYIPEIIDHINRDKNDNRIENLRDSNHSQNAMNAVYVHKIEKTSKYRGVSRNKNTGKWDVAIWVDGKSIYIGSYEDEYTAAIAFNRAAKEHHGEGIWLNDVIDDGRDTYYKKKKQKSENTGILIKKNGSAVARLHGLIKGKSFYIGTFKTKIEAIFAYNEACIKYNMPHKMHKLEE